MTAKLTIEINIKAIRQFAALSNIDLTDEHESKIIGSTTLITGEEMQEMSGDDLIQVGLAGIVIAKQLENE